PALSTLSLHDALPILEAQVQAQVEVVARGLLDHRHDLPLVAPRVHLDSLLAGLSPEHAVVGLLDAGFADNAALDQTREVRLLLLDRKSTRLNSSHLVI